MDTLSTLNQPFQRATLSIDRRYFRTVRAFIATHGNDLTEPAAAWAVGKQDVTSRHEGRDKVNLLPNRSALGRVTRWLYESFKGSAEQPVRASGFQATIPGCLAVVWQLSLLVLFLRVVSTLQSVP